MFFGPIGKQDGRLASDWLRHLRLLCRNRWTEFNETWQETRSQRPPPSLCFSGLSENKMAAWPLIGWDIFDFSSETAERNSTKLDRKQALNAFYHVCVFKANRVKTKCPPWPLIGWDLFNFSSDTAERNSTKFDRKQDLNALYQVCVLQVDRKNKMAAQAYDLLRHFQLFLWNRWIKYSTKLDRKQDLNILYQACVFRADQKNKIAARAYDWLRHFRLLLWNHWREFNETWQKASSQRPLPSLCFSGWSKKQYGRPGLWLAKTYFDFSSETAERNYAKLDRKQDLKVLYQVCVFRAEKWIKIATLANPSKKVAHCTQVHIMGPFGPLVD